MGDRKMVLFHRSLFSFSLFNTHKHRQTHTHIRPQTQEANRQDTHRHI